MKNDLKGVDAKSRRWRFQAVFLDGTETMLEGLSFIGNLDAAKREAAKRSLSFEKSDVQKRWIMDVRLICV